MSTEHSVTQWINGLKAGDEEAAQRLWERYFGQLVRLAGKKLKHTSRRRADEEDVALSAFDSLCRGAGQGKFPHLADREDLWRLLIVITARKACDHAMHEQRQKRGGGQVRGESVFRGRPADSTFADLEQVIGEEPTPQFASQVAEQMQNFLAALPDATLRQIAQWKLENYSHQEIARNLNVSEETIRRKLNRIKLILSQSLAEDAS